MQDPDFSQRPSDSEGLAPDATLPHRFLFNINFVLVFTLVSNTAGFFVAIILARALGPDGRGVAALYLTAVSLGFAILNLGIGSAAFYFVTRRELTPRQSMEAALTISVFAAAVAAIAVIVARVFFGDDLAEKHIPYGLAIIAVPTFIQLRTTEALLRAAGRFGALNAVELALPISVLLTLGAVELTAGLTVGRAVIGWTFAILPPLAACFVMVGTDAWPRAFAPLKQIVHMIRFGGQSWLNALIQLLNYRVDLLMILVFVNTAGVGVYSVSTSQTEGLWVISNSVAIVLLTNITAGDAANAARLTPVVARNTLLVTAVVAIIAAVIAGFWIPVVFGADYEDSVAPYLWPLPGTVALAGSQIFASFIFSRGRPIINAWIGLVTLIVTIPTNVALIHFFGVPGAAISTSIGYTLDLALTALAYRYLSGNPIAEALIPRSSDRTR